MIKPALSRLGYSIVIAVGLIFFSTISAFSAESASVASENAPFPAEVYTTGKKLTNPDLESLVPSAGRDLSKSHFTWGAEVGSSIDLGGNDMSSFDFSVMFGYKNAAIQIVGLGAGIRRSFGSQNTFIPLVGVIQTSFRAKPSLLFMHFEAGYSFNSIANAHIRGDICGSLGLGFNLSASHRFRSYILIAYGFQHFDVKHREEAGLKADNVPLAQLSFGITF